ncbi:MAG: hypothetical protein F6K21_27855 [Symploca sp. SIO2D2]|nr:hypothetical protein [Symploca sp. SIO2D2]
MALISCQCKHHRNRQAIATTQIILPTTSTDQGLKDEVLGVGAIAYI